MKGSQSPTITWHNPPPPLHPAPRCLGHSNPYRHDNVVALPRGEVWKMWGRSGAHVREKSSSCGLNRGRTWYSLDAAQSPITAGYYSIVPKTLLIHANKTKAKTTAMCHSEYTLYKNIFHWQGLKKCTFKPFRPKSSLVTAVLLLLLLLFLSSEKSQRRGAVRPDHVPSGHHRERLLWPALYGLCTSAGETVATLPIMFFYHFKSQYAFFFFSSQY